MLHSLMLLMKQLLCKQFYEPTKSQDLLGAFPFLDPPHCCSGGSSKSSEQTRLAMAMSCMLFSWSSHSSKSKFSSSSLVGCCVVIGIYEEKAILIYLGTFIFGGESLAPLSVSDIAANQSAPK